MVKPTLRINNDPLNAVYESREYKDVCRKSVLNFPIIIDIEISGRCNLNCIMCTRQNKVSRKLENMDEKLFYKVVDQAAEYGAKLIRFSGYGEALMHKKFIPFLRYAKEKGLLTHLTTNGHLLTEKICAGLVNIPLDKIKFSFQGTEEKEYDRMRAVPGGYKKLAGKIKMLKRIRDEMCKELPIIQIATTVLDETADQIKKFYDEWKGVADAVYHLPTLLWRLEGTKFGKEDGHRVRGKLLDAMCIEVRTKVSVWNDGKVSGCCGDHFHQLLLGDINEKTLKEIWDDKSAREIRELLQNKPPAIFAEEEKKRFPLCAGCTSMNIETIAESD